jgi:putative ABC transport system permease protein
MGAVRLKTIADMRHRRLQSAVIAVVLCLASGAATLALSILVMAHGPFDAAFARANGAHLVIDYDGSIPADRLRATGDAPVVTASAGPWPVSSGAVGHPLGGRVNGGSFSGRPQPDPSIDAIEIQAGRWWQSPGEAVLDQDTAHLLGLGIGDTVELFPEPQIDLGGKGAGGPVELGGKPPEDPTPGHRLTIVGIAASVSTPDVAVWTDPADIVASTPGSTPAQEMLYRVDPAASAADLTAAALEITRSLPPTAVTGTQTYLEVKSDVDQLADLYVPVLLAFSVFALLAAAFSIANAVSGIVLSSYRDIGVMKAVGYTPGQVTTTLVGQIVVPAVIGAVIGIALGMVASQPVVEQTAQSFGLPAEFVASWPVIVAVLGIALATAFVASVGPAIRAGRLSAVGAMTHGTAPAMHADGGRLRRLGLGLPFPLPARLGVAAGLAHPLRAGMTLGALVVGVAAVTFAVGLDWSLVRVVDQLNRNAASPVRAELHGSFAAPIATTDADAASAPNVAATIAADPGTGRFVSIGQADVIVPRVGSVPFVGYDRDTSWLGYELIHGRWSTAPGEAVAPTNLFTQSGLRVGDTVTIGRDGHSVTIRLVGQIFDTAEESDTDLVIRGSWTDLATLDPTVQPSRWEMQPASGTETRSYLTRLQDQLNPGVNVWAVSDSSSDESFILFLSVVGLLGVVLVAISVGGVFNTVLLETRQRTHEMAVLKGIGQSPVQVIGMVLASIVPAGVLAGLIGVPLGMAAQRAVLTYMGQVAAKTTVPESAFDVFPPIVLLPLLLAGLAIGAVGAFLPAHRAAYSRIAPVLQAE